MTLNGYFALKSVFGSASNGLAYCGFQTKLFVNLHSYILHTWPLATRQLSRDATVDDLGDISRSLDCFASNYSRTVRDSLRQKLLQSILIGNHALAIDRCHFLWPWSTFEGHFSLGCHFHVHFSNLWHAFASCGLPAIAELLDGLETALGQGYIAL